MKSKEDEKIDLYYTVQPMTYFARLLGLWPHTIKRSSPGVSTAGLLWYFLVMSVYIYVFYLNLDRTFWDEFKDITKSEIQAYGSWIQVLSGLGIGMVSLVVTMCTFRKQWTFFETMKEIDDILTVDFAVITPKKIFRTITFFFLFLNNLVLLGLLVLAYYVFSTVLQTTPINICISYYLANLPYSCVIMIFYFSMTAITRRFYLVNNILRQLTPRHIPKNVFELASRTERNDRLQPTIALNEIYSIYGAYMKKPLPMSPPSKNADDLKMEIKKLTTKLESREHNLLQDVLRRNVIEIEEYKLSKMNSVEEVIEHLTKLLDVHDLLLDCIGLQNELLSFQMLLIVAQIFVFEVFALFSLYRVLYNTSLNSNVLALLNAVWLLVYNFILHIIMSMSSNCVNEGKLTGSYCHKVINKISHTADPRIIEKLSIMSHQLTMRVPNITCGLFSFDWELMFSIVSATSIYLIFLVQFDVAGNPNIPTTT